MLYIIQTSRHTSHSRTLIDNFFSNVISKDIICGNITATISEHWPQFLVSPNTIANPPSNKSNAFERDWSTFDQENFILVYFHIDSVFLTHVSIRQMPTWLPTWKAKSLYHVSTFLPTWFFVPLEKEKFKTIEIKLEKNPYTQANTCLLHTSRNFKDILIYISFTLYL